jgi:hypothetical protein
VRPEKRCEEGGGVKVAIGNRRESFTDVVQSGLEV